MIKMRTKIPQLTVYYENSELFRHNDAQISTLILFLSGIADDCDTDALNNVEIELRTQKKTPLLTSRWPPALTDERYLRVLWLQRR